MSTTTTTPCTTTGASQKAIISKILVAIDGSDASMDAADYAISTPKVYDAELYACMLYVLTLIYSGHMKHQSL